MCSKLEKMDKILSLDILAKRAERVKEEVCYTTVCVSIADSVGLRAILLSLFSYRRNLRMLEDQILQDDCCISRRTFRFYEI